MEYVFEYSLRQLDREADMSAYARFEGIVGSDEEQPIGIKK